VAVKTRNNVQRSTDRSAALPTGLTLSLCYGARVRREELPDGYRLHERLGHASFHRHNGDVALVVYDGGLTNQVLPSQFESFAEIVAEMGGVAVFIDAEALTSYTTDFRKDWTSWFRANRSELRECHVLIRSALVRMGVNLVNPLIGNLMRPHSDRASFTQALSLATAEPPSRAS